MTTRIVALAVHRVSVPLLRPFVTAQRTATVHDAVLVELRDADGCSGWGEAPCSWRVTGESPESVTAAVNGPLAACVVGADPLDYRAVAARLAAAVIHNAAARSAVESALLDLAAQQHGVTLVQLLSGAVTPARSPRAMPQPMSVLTDMTIAAGSTDEVVSAALDHVAGGFTTLKVKAGAGGDDRTTLVAVRDAVGRDIRLRVDANQGWSASQAVEIIGAWEAAEVGIELVEQPVAARAIEDLAFVTARVETPIMADEAVWTLPDLLQVIRHSAAGLVNLKLAKTGGPTEALRMAAVARENGMRVLVGSMMESQVGIAAAASLAAVLDSDGESGQVHDLDAGLWLRSSPVAGGSHYAGSQIVLSTQAGLGIVGIS